MSAQKRSKRKLQHNAASTTTATTTTTQHEDKMILPSSTNTAYATGVEGTMYRRIRTPHENDVLSGRGGGINAHEGNVRFRAWVSTRKNDYTLAPTKTEKTRVAQEVINLVRGQEPSGRFLQKDPTHVGMGGWWVEIDEERVMAKTSQALREGAPQIRAAHQRDPVKTKSGRKSTRKVVAVATTPTSRKRVMPATTNTRGYTSTPATAMSSTSVGGSALSKRIGYPGISTLQEKALQQLRANVVEAQHQQEFPTEIMDNNAQVHEMQTEMHNVDAYMAQSVSPLEPATKRVRLEYNGQTVHPTDVTPPLTALGAKEHPEHGEPPILSLDNVPSPRKQLSSADRAHSLALTDFTAEEWTNEEFVNPFEDETFLFEQRPGMQSPPPLSEQRDSSSSAPSIPSPRPGVYRENSTASDMAGLGALYKNNNNNGSDQTTTGVRARGSISSMSSSRSLVQDLAKAVRSTSAQTDFDEGMKDIFDYQDYVNETSELERKIDIQRRLFPYRGSKFAYLRRKKSSSDSAQ
eukprot:CAMPEP_0168739828 /NCGR_PEP_ID=MMETSP0724-20121128/11663_1 /TAXON_ID=265536 /ORGANISM="Amphiprora sp., Strain CCMP467" /LENGTH=520 /DNA_ID=CAMNT_0008787241 /DNA_START=301 /DNA_END=1863 /DNA_ORIENTATION=+